MLWFSGWSQTAKSVLHDRAQTFNGHPFSWQRDKNIHQEECGTFEKIIQLYYPGGLLRLTVIV